MALSFFREKPWAIFLVVFWMCVIFIMSSFPGAAGRYEMPLLLLLERKGAHVFEFFVLALFAWNAFRVFSPMERAWLLVGLSSAFSLAYAFLDETHQLFVPFREGKISDVGIDGIGIILFISGYVLWKAYRKK